MMPRLKAKHLGSNIFRMKLCCWAMGEFVMSKNTVSLGWKQERNDGEFTQHLPCNEIGGGWADILWKWVLKSDREPEEKREATQEMLTFFWPQEIHQTQHCCVTECVLSCVIRCWVGADTYWANKGRRASGSQQCCTGHIWDFGMLVVWHQPSNSLVSLVVTDPCSSIKMGKAKLQLNYSNQLQTQFVSSTQ